MGGNNRKNHLKLLNEENTVPVHYKKLKGDEFVEWIAGLKTSEGHTYDLMQWIHMVLLFLIYIVCIEKTFPNILSVIYLHHGLKLTRVIKAGLVGDRLKDGKDPLKFQLYCSWKRGNFR